MTIRLSFGTAGIRAALGPGDDQINVRTVRGVARALCSYLLEQQPDAAERGICIGFDGRTDSDLFAHEVARVALAHGLRVRAFEAPVPTPLLAHCTRRHGAAAGVMITASHNPPHENGLKIYGRGGGQLVAPHDRELARRISCLDERELDALAIPAPPAARAEGSAALPDAAYEPLGESDLDAYLDAVLALLPERPGALHSTPDASGWPAPPRFAYSALCGVGGALTRRLLARIEVTGVIEVARQADPRADFGGLSSPNPEHESALAALIACMEQAQLELGFAHDPDADRLATIVREPSGALRILSGDEVGALLGAFLLERCPNPERALLMSTLVSGDLLARVAGAAGARFERTPTGFKWIAARARALERAEGVQFLFGYEEAIGYAFGAIADDKDGIAALYVLLELARALRARGSSLPARLDELARRHGLFAARQITLARDPEHPAGYPANVMDALRAVAPEALLGPGTTRTDHATLPAAIDLLIFQRGDGARLCARPSGTEPKLKFYLHAGAAAASEGSLEPARREAERRLDELEAALCALQHDQGQPERPA